MEPAGAPTPRTYRYRGRRAGIALGVVAGLVALVGIGAFVAEGATGPGFAGLAAAAAAIGLCALALRALRNRGVRLEPGRIGRIGARGATRWCDLADVVHRGVHEYGVVFGGRQRNLVLWTATGGDRGLTARFARAGTSAEQRRSLAAAEAAAGGGLAPFVVELDDLPPGADVAILAHVDEVGHPRG